ncbi:hypothetical protein Bp8pS_068 [Bacillus phage vB_BpuM-BpSp]|nr:hypothetical protein Bp8pS_068 [Bacillus phage vB_BpuM-BpSp]
MSFEIEKIIDTDLFKMEHEEIKVSNNKPFLTKKEKIYYKYGLTKKGKSKKRKRKDK